MTAKELIAELCKLPDLEVKIITVSDDGEVTDVSRLCNPPSTVPVWRMGDIQIE